MRRDLPAVVSTTANLTRREQVGDEQTSKVFGPAEKRERELIVL